MTEYSVVFSAIALPLTYLPILIVANDPGYMGDARQRSRHQHRGIGLPCHHPGRVAGRHPADDRHRSRPMTLVRQRLTRRTPTRGPAARRPPAPAGPSTPRRRRCAGRHRRRPRTSTASSRCRRRCLGTPAPLVTGILTGQVLATRIFGGQPPPREATAAAVAAGREDRHRRPTARARGQIFDCLWLEHWLRDHIIGRIPGGSPCS